MKLSQVKQALTKIGQVRFALPSGSYVPEHFHVTEIGSVNKKFIDCGGVVRSEDKISFQLWEANDYDHRLAPDKLINIIDLSEKILNLEDKEVEVEYQFDTIGRYGLDFDGSNFLLTALQTDCLAKDHCVIPKEKLPLAELTNSSSCCTPGGGCC